MAIEEKIAERAMQVIARIFKKDVSELSRDTRFVEDLDAKSVNFAQLVAVLEDEFKVAIPFMEARRKQTVGEAIDFIVYLRTR
jgi:acyl carrier protein